jgi:O-antigen ligase
MIVKDHPLGIGLQSYEQVMPVYNSLGPPGIKFTHAHSDYLELLAEGGWPGFLALVGGFYVFLGRSIWKIKQRGKDISAERLFIGIGACSGLISMAFHSFFDFNLQIPANLLYFIVLIVILYSCVWNTGFMSRHD